MPKVELFSVREKEECDLEQHWSTQVFPFEMQYNPKRRIEKWKMKVA